MFRQRRSTERARNPSHRELEKAIKRGAEGAWGSEEVLPKRFVSRLRCGEQASEFRQRAEWVE